MATPAKNAGPSRRTPVRVDQPRRGLWVALAAIAVVLVALVVLVVVKVTAKDTKKAAPAATGSGLAAAVTAATSVPPATLDTIGRGGAQAVPRPLPGTVPPVTADGKPRVVYVGANYCPFCAAQRWAMVVALGRFGTFSNLGATTSAGADVFPNTATFTFHGSSYTSRYLSFTAVETRGNKPQGGSYEPLETMPADVAQLFGTYARAPYVPAESAGSIPWTLFGNKFVASGAFYSPGLLAGKDMAAIGAELGNPSSKIAQAVDGSANGLTAALCKLTGGQPGNVCSSAAVTAFGGVLGAGG